MSVNNASQIDDSGEIVFRNQTHTHNENVESADLGIVHSSPIRVTNEPNREFTQPGNRDELIKSIQEMINVEFSNFSHVVKGQIADLNCKVDSQFENMQDSLDKVKDETYRLRQDVTELQCKAHNPNFLNPPPTLSYEGPRPRGVQSLLSVNRDHNFSNSGRGDTHRRPDPTLQNDDTLRPLKSNAKPRSYDGNDDFGEYLSQFEIISELNKWDYHTKSLQLAGALAGPAVGILGELTPSDRRDFNTLVKALNTRFGSAERSELFRARLKVMKKGKDENLSQLAQSVKKLTRQAYPDADQSMLNILSLDYFIDALPDPDMRLRIRESKPSSITEAETLAIRLETYHLADSNKGLSVNAVTSRNSTFSDPILSCLKEIKQSLNQNFGKLSQGINDIKSTCGQGRRRYWGNDKDKGGKTGPKIDKGKDNSLQNNQRSQDTDGQESTSAKHSGSSPQRENF